MAIKVAIIGHFGGSENLVDGQTVKTKNLYQELKENTDWKIHILDTYYKDKKPVKLGFELLWMLFTIKHIIILVSGNGMKFFFPILYVYSKVFRGNVYHDVIGGNLHDYVKRYPKYKKYLNSFRVNWIESDLLKRKLEDIGVTNAEVIVNFRRKEMVSLKELEQKYEKPFKFCTFSRVSRDKGIDEAVKAIKAVNDIAGEDICTLDIYGPIDEEYKNEFFKSVESCKAIMYKGIILSDEAVDVLKKYYATLFPTHWDGEGSAGTIIESQFAGIPVIATDWHCNSEMIESGVDGVIYPGEEADTLKEAIMWIINQKDRMPEIKRNSRRRAETYLPEKSLLLIISKITKE